MSLEIMEIAAGDDLAESCRVIRDSFVTVADDLGLTPENCPTNPAFISRDALAALREKMVRLFGLFDGGEQTGFIAIERASEELYYIEKLAVLPAHRHRGCGRMLMDHAFDHVRQCGGKRVSIGIIDENRVLKEWYRSYGFVETGTKRFEHLPFTVCFMEKRAS